MEKIDLQINADKTRTMELIIVMKTGQILVRQKGSSGRLKIDYEK